MCLMCNDTGREEHVRYGGGSAHTLPGKLVMEPRKPCGELETLVDHSERPDLTPGGEIDCRGGAHPAVADVVEFVVPGRAEMISHIRSLVAEVALTMPFGAEQVEDIKIAVGEAGSNALRHGANPEWCKIAVRVERGADWLRVFIADRGCGFDPDAVQAAFLDPLSDSGRGIMLMRALMDEVTFHFDSPGTRVELVKRLQVDDGS